MTRAGFGAVVGGRASSGPTRRGVGLLPLPEVLTRWRRRRRERLYLAAADHRLLRELLAQGHDAAAEVAKPAWRR